MFETLESLKNAGAKYDVNTVNIILGEHNMVTLIHYEDGWKFNASDTFLQQETFISIEEVVNEMNTHWEGFKGFQFRYNLWNNMLKVIAQGEGLRVNDSYRWGFVCHLKPFALNNDVISVVPLGLDEIKLEMHVHGGEIPNILIKGSKTKIIETFKEHCKSFKEMVNEQKGDTGKTKGFQQHQI